MLRVSEMAVDLVRGYLEKKGRTVKTKKDVRGKCKGIDKPYASGYVAVLIEGV